MREYPTMSKSNEPKEPTMWDDLRTKVDSEMTGFDEAMRVVEQSKTYDGGQMDLFPNELVKESSLFLSKVEADE